MANKKITLVITPEHHIELWTNLLAACAEHQLNYHKYYRGLAISNPFILNGYSIYQVPVNEPAETGGPTFRMFTQKDVEETMNKVQDVLKSVGLVRC